jgi:hypothetical protein
MDSVFTFTNPSNNLCSVSAHLANAAFLSKQIFIRRCRRPVNMANEFNPYEPPKQVRDTLPLVGRFYCPRCETKQAFLSHWLLQPFGRCSHCRTRLVVRRAGLHKLWTPFLLCLFFPLSGVFVFAIGGAGVVGAPVCLCICAGIDCYIAHRIGYFDTPHGFF